MRCFLHTILFVPGMALTVPFGAAKSADLELVFAADSSGSIDDDELMLQRQGYVNALSDL